MVQSLDESVGRVLDHLKQCGLDRNTIVVFASDNGGYIGTDRKAGQPMPVTNNAPLRSGKGSLYEGGIRVPLVVRWPQVTPAGAACETPVTLMDLAVALRAAGAPASLSAAGVDGLDLTPLLKDPAVRLPREALYFHYPHYYETTTPVSAVRAGDWKLLEYLEDNRVELYQLRDDPAERTDLAQERPEKAAELRTLLHTWRQSVDAALPRANPDFRSRG